MPPLTGILALIPGITICFFGYRLLRFTLTVAGLALGGYLGYFISTKLSATAWLTVLLIVVMGILGAVVTSFLYKAAVFLVGFAAGALIVAVFPSGSGWNHLLFIALGGIIGGILAIFLQRPVISFLTAFLGAWWIVIGIFHLLGKTRIQLPATYDLPVMALSWLALGVTGFIVQFSLTGKEKKK